MPRPTIAKTINIATDKETAAKLAAPSLATIKLSARLVAICPNWPKMMGTANLVLALKSALYLLYNDGIIKTTSISVNSFYYFAKFRHL